VKLIQALIEVWFRDQKIINDCSKLTDSTPNTLKCGLKIQEVIFVTMCLHMKFYNQLPVKIKMIRC